MKKIRVKVTGKHIDEGEPGDSFRCPIALAVKEATNVATRDVTLVDGIEISVGPFVFKATLKVKEFIKSFDKGKKVKPFTFWLE